MIYCYSSGTITLDEGIYDVFAAGGGAGMRLLCGGGGGYTKTVKKVKLSGNYPVVIGACGPRLNYGQESSCEGGASSLGNIISAKGGANIIKENMNSDRNVSSPGGAGGSGGGAGGYTDADYGGDSDGGNGGSDGGAGGDAGKCSGGVYSARGGRGQGTTTRAFGEQNNTLYSGGGAGAGGYDESKYDEGGYTHTKSGIGGKGGGATRNGDGYSGILSALPNTGGGGGRVYNEKNEKCGSGIVIVRWGY